MNGIGVVIAIQTISKKWRMIFAMIVVQGMTEKAPRLNLLLPILKHLMDGGLKNEAEVVY